MFSMIFGIISAALSAFQGFSSSQSQISQAQNQARVMQANAELTRRNAAREAEAARMEARELDRRKSGIRSEFQEMQAANSISLGAGNVDMASGSALDVSLGNIQNFAADMGDNAYAVAMKRWDAAERERLGRQQAHIMDENASWLSQSSGNMLTSLLSAGLGAFGGFSQGYTVSGGSLSKLFGARK